MTALQVVQKFYPEVVTVKDATRALKVEVLKRDINSSAVRNHKACAFAVACKRTTQVDGAVVAIKVAYLVKDGNAVRYSMPESLSREIVAFDRNGEFSAGQYRLLKPTHRLGDPAASGSRKSKGRGSAKTVGEPRYRHATQAIRSMNDAD